MAFTKRGVDLLSALIVVAMGLTIGVGWFIPLWHLEALRAAELERASALALGQSRILRAHAEQAFDAAAVAFRSLDQRPDRDGIQTPADPKETHVLLRQIRDGSPLFAGLGMVDTAGRVVASADRHPPAAVDLSDRGYFAAHRDSPSLDLRIGAPVIARPSNLPAIPLSMRVDDGQGGFAGLIAGRLRPAVLEALYRSAGADAAALFLGDGRVLVSVVDPSLIAGGVKLPAFRPIERLLPAHEGIADIGGAGEAAWLVGYSRSSRYGVVVAIGFEKERLLADWRRSRVGLLTLAAGRTAIVLVIAALLLWWLRRQLRLSMALLAARDAADEARLSAEAANRSKSEFLTHMSHELRTPLNAVLGFSEMMSDERLGPVGNPRYREYAQIVNASSGHLLAVINSILDLAKVDAGKWEVAAEPVALHGLARDLRNLTVGRAEASNVHLAIDIPENLPKPVTDRRLLLQILVNLMTNAIKFTPAGGRIDVTATAGPDGIAIRVADTGCGMSAEDLASLREPFRRSNSERGRQQHDTGLGLPLSLRFTDLIGGWLDIESQPGEGTRATLHLPLQGHAVGEA